MTDVIYQYRFIEHIKFPRSEVLAEPLIRDCYSKERVVEGNVT